MSNWEDVFIQSRINGGNYEGDNLPDHKWQWPKDTFLQKKLEELKREKENGK